MSSAQPLVSVIIPAHGVAGWIGEAVGSVLQQTMTDREVIVVNDGSPDTPELERALEPLRPRITYLRQPNLGVAAARNAGIEVARGEWVAFLDGDDAWEDRFLSRQLAFAEMHGLEMVWSDGRVVGEGARVGSSAVSGTGSDRPVTVVSLIRQEHSVVTSATMVRRKVLVEAGGFDVRLWRAQDFELWVRLVHSGVRAGFNPDCLVRYRVRAGNLSGGARDQVDRAIAVMRHLRQHLGLDPGDAAVLADRIGELEARRDVIEGKELLSQGRYSEARSRFSAANLRLRAPKLGLIRLGLAVAPALTRWLYLRTAADRSA
jgi:glycosyltransferase involved in cell wall biosynthesis